MPVSADRAISHGPHTGAKSRDSRLGALLPVRDGLSAGGKWIRTSGPREIALRSRSALALHLGSLALRRRGPDWNGRPTAEAGVPHREEIPSVPTASLRSDVFGLGTSLPTCRSAPTPAEKPGCCRRVSTGDIERIFRHA